MKRGLLQLSGIVVDLLHRIGHAPRSGEEVEATAFVMTAGGGFNAMVAAKRMGAPVTYGGVLGQGPFADIAIRGLHEQGIAVASKRRAAVDQGTCIVLVDKEGERSFVTFHGAERKIDLAYLETLDAPSYDCALLTGYSLYKPESAAAVSAWIARLGSDPVLFFDPGPTIAEIPKSDVANVMNRADWVSANAAEARILTGAADPAEAAMQLSLSRTGALVRDGAQGCWLAMKGEAQHLQGFEVNCIDSTGAGDTHDGAFLAGLIKGARPVDAAILANAAAALSTTRVGPATAPDLEETRSFLKDSGRDVTHFEMM